MNKLIKFFIIFSIILGSCQTSPQKAMIVDNIIKIDISKSYPRSEKRDKDIIDDTEYVPLETTNDVLVDKYASLFYVSEKFIVIIERGHGDIFVFNRKGKIVTHLCRKGKGPEEYNAISSIVFDETNEKIFVFDFPNSGRILVYSITGEYKQTLRYSTDLSLIAYNFDEETMFVYDTNNLYNKNYNKKPYMLMSKKDGNIISVLNISLPARYDTRVYDRFKDSSGQSWTTSSNFSIPNRRHDGQDFVISDISSDTIYKLTKSRKLIPFIIRTPSVHSTDPHLVCTCNLITDKYIFLHITTLDYFLLQKGKSPLSKILMYEFETGEISNVGYNNVTNVNLLQKNIDARMIDAVYFTDAYKENKLSGELKQLAATLDEEDNPVVMITKFK